jgi:membrane fusion protein, heavy metal efflux system
MRALRAIALSCLLLGCGRGHDHDNQGHDQGGAGHGHGGEAEELPGQSVTMWTDKHELFMEYDPLVVGAEIAFAAHVTLLPNQAAASGRVTVALRLQGGAAVQARADAPASAGIFRPTMAPTAAGPCQMTVIIETQAGRDELAIEGCAVHADVAAAKKALGGEEETPGRITYLKEQAWKTEFATIAVVARDLQPAVRATAEIKPAPGKEARLTAPTAGRVTLASPVPTLGMRVDKGQLLATILPGLDAADRSGLEADVAANRAELDAATAQLARAERLHGDRAISERQLEEARTRAAIARARLDGARGRLGQLAAGASGRAGATRGSFRVTSPLAGTLVAADVTGAQTVAEGDPLFSVMDLSSLWLEARVFEPDIPKVSQPTGAWFEIEGWPEPLRIEPPDGRLVTVGRVIDPRSRTVPVIFEMQNPDGRLRVGQFAVAWIATGKPVRALAVPDSAIVDDAGKPVAYVQVEGEAFERRPLTVGLRSAGWTEIRAGITDGERVVTQGAYEIKLASAAGAVPAHGHAH